VAPRLTGPCAKRDEEMGKKITREFKNVYCFFANGFWEPKIPGKSKECRVDDRSTFSANISGNTIEGKRWHTMMKENLKQQEICAKPCYTNKSSKIDSESLKI
jgi:hypothetical protein